MRDRMITTDRVHIAARGLYSLHLAEHSDWPGSFDDLPDYMQGMYIAKGERALYDLVYSDCKLGPKAVERLFQ